MADKVESIGYGTTVFVDDGASSAYVGIDNLIDCDPPAEKLNTVESKRLNIAGGVLVSVPTLFDPGECQVYQQFTNAGFSRMETLRKAKTLCHFKFTIVDDVSGTTVIVPGYVTQNQTEKVEADKITAFTTMFKVAGAAS
jgi:hypothetical protein